jgi:hypothetical protein
MLDYGRSFIEAERGQGNKPRFTVESCLSINGDNFYQCASCKSENTFGEGTLFTHPNYDFIPVFGPGFAVCFRNDAFCNKNNCIVYDNGEMWGNVRYRLVNVNTEKLNDFKDISNAVDAGCPLILQVTVDDGPFTIECPVKTLNIDREKKLWQVDTGPVVLPDRVNSKTLLLAFVAANRMDSVDFIINVPTKVTYNNDPEFVVHHYSCMVKVGSENSLYAVVSKEANV